MNLGTNFRDIVLQPVMRLLGFRCYFIGKTFEETPHFFKATASLFLSIFIPLSMLPMDSYSASVTTQRNNNYRTGHNNQEIILNTSNVNVNSFGKLYTYNLANMFPNISPSMMVMETQLLYLPSVNINGTAVKVIFVCTVYNSCFAIDDTHQTPLWQVTLGSVQPTYTYQNQGVRGTPVIDAVSNTLYVVAKTQTYDGNSHFQLHALDIATGAEKNNGPVEIQGSVLGTGVGSVNGILTFNPVVHIQRPSLLLQNGNLYIGFGAYEDDPLGHGWVFSYNATTLQFNSAVSTSPDLSLASIWQLGNGLAADDNGFIYLFTGNSYDLTSSIGFQDFSESLLKIDTSNNQLKIVDYFTPSNHQVLNTGDSDLSSSGPLLIPGSPFVVGGGKDGKLFLSNSNRLGHFNPIVDLVLQEYQITNKFTLNSGADLGIWGGNTYYDSSSAGIRQGIFYIWSRQDHLKAINFKNQSFYSIQHFIPPDNSQHTEGAMLAVSSNGTQPGSTILWSMQNSRLDAFDASNISNLLWNSSQNYARDAACGYVASIRGLPQPPVVADGKVYVPTNGNCNVILVYGLLH